MRRALLTVTSAGGRLRGRPLAPWARRICLVLLGATLVVAGAIVFGPKPPAKAGQTALHHWTAVWQLGGVQPTFLTFTMIEWLANVVMFLPLGFLAAGVVRPGARLWVVPLATVGSVTIETVQFFIPERVSSVTDVVANTLGAAVGVWLLARWSNWRAERGW